MQTKTLALMAVQANLFGVASCVVWIACFLLGLQTTGSGTYSCQVVNGIAYPADGRDREATLTNPVAKRKTMGVSKHQGPQYRSQKCHSHYKDTHKNMTTPNWGASSFRHMGVCQNQRPQIVGLLLQEHPEQRLSFCRNSHHIVLVGIS